MTVEELYIKNIENGIRAIRLGTKKPSETLAPVSLNRLKQINIGMYEDYLAKYKRILADYNKRKDSK